MINVLISVPICMISKISEVFILSKTTYLRIEDLVLYFPSQCTLGRKMTKMKRVVLVLVLVLLMIGV